MRCKQYGYEVSPKIEEEFKYHKTHNDGVFSAYTKDVREARHVGLLTGLPDAYGRGRIIGDYRRVALYGVNRLIEEKQKDKDALGSVPTTEKEIRCAEELSDQIKALKDMIKQWRLPTALISPVRRRTQRRPFSGCTLAIWPASRSRTARQ